MGNVFCPQFPPPQHLPRFSPPRSPLWGKRILKNKSSDPPEGCFSDVPPDGCYTTNATDVILVHLFQKHREQSLKKCLFLYVFPRKGTLTDAGDGDGGEQQNLKQTSRYQYMYMSLKNQTFRTTFVHISGRFSKMQKCFKYVHIYRKCHRIQYTHYK